MIKGVFVQRRRRAQREASIQVECIKYFRFAYPMLSLNLFAIPNGGSRNEKEAANLKRQGVLSGVSDLFLMIPAGKFHGLWIEMKAGKNTPTINQEAFLKTAQINGYAAVVCYSFDEFKETIDNYLRLR